MKSSDWAKFPYLCTLYVNVSPMAIAKYVEDQVSVPVVIETRSSVKDAVFPSPWSNKSRENEHY